MRRVPLLLITVSLIVTESVLQYRKCIDLGQTDFLQSIRLQCTSCQLFMQPSTFDAASCVACRRGGYRCVKQSTETGSLQSSSTVQELYTILSLCRLKGNECLQRVEAVPRRDEASLPADTPVHISVTLETKLIDMAREIEMQLEKLAHLYASACIQCRQRKSKCSLRVIKPRPAARQRSSIAYRPLLPIQEVLEGRATGVRT